VITVVFPEQTVAGVADAAATEGAPEQGVKMRRLSKPMSDVPRSLVARKRMTVVAEVLVSVYSLSAQPTC
jgi:hypothetical protein